VIYFLEQRYRELVQHNQGILNYCRSRPQTKSDDQMLTASVDVAIARLNTILLKLIQHPISAEEYNTDVKKCQDAIDSFYYYIQKMDRWPNFTRWFWRYLLHRTGKKKMPHIKTLLNIVKENVQ
jgi:hypothetical protein